MKKKNRIYIGTRGSKLALWQAEWVKSEIQRMHPEIEISLIKIKTTGDKILNVPLAKIGGKGLFVKEIEEALLDHKIDMAVHSMKDVPTELPEELHLAAICKREDPRDALITKVQSLRFKVQSFKDLPHGATVGTSSLRRLCQLRNIRPDLKIVQLRGNLDTRIRKLDEGQFDAIIVAVAGVKRLGLAYRITEILEPEICLPATGQGAVGIECRVNDKVINTILGGLNHQETSISVRAERAFLRRLGGGCQVPIAAYARIEQRAKRIEQRAQSTGERAKGIEQRVQNTVIKNTSHVTRYLLLVMDGLVGSITGERVIKDHAEGRPEDSERLGTNLAEDLLSMGAKEILAEVYQVS